MSRGEFFTRFTIWITLAGYFLVASFLASSLGGHSHELYTKWSRWMRWIWTIACVSLLVHVACAYQFYHHWSQDSAYRETARQTAEVVGIKWGGGIYFNYALMVGWVADVAWWWRGLEAYRLRPRLVTLLWHAFLMFMVFNSMVVFKAGAMRLAGIILCLMVCTFWWYSSRKA